MFINFIWRGRIHAVNKFIHHAPTEVVCLNMIRVKDIDQGVKLTWPRKFIKNKEPWYEIATNLLINRVFFAGQRKIILIVKNCHNIFLKNVCRAPIRIHYSVSYVSPLDIGKPPLRENPLINTPYSISIIQIQHFTGLRIVILFNIQSFNIH